MTIGIGVLCCTKPKNQKFRPGEDEGVRPDTLIMLADTMGSTDYDSTDDLYKMYISPDVKLYGTGAGNMEMCSEIFAYLEQQLRKATEPRTHGTMLTLINQAVHGHRSQHFQIDVLQSTHLPLIRFANETAEQLTPQWKHEQIERDWREYDTGASLLIGSFDDNGQALLYFVGRIFDSNGDVSPRLVHPCFFPGYRCVGIGSRNANFWLTYRGQTLGLSPKQSVYHAYEAKVMAANAPTVNDRTEVLIVSKDQKPFYFSEKLHAPKDSPVSLAELETMFLKYGPQDTRKDLGHPIPKTSKNRR